LAVFQFPGSRRKEEKGDTAQKLEGMERKKEGGGEKKSSSMDVRDGGSEKPSAIQ